MSGTQALSRVRGGEHAEEQNSSEREGEGRGGDDECRDEAAAWAQGSRVVAQEIRCWQGENIALPLVREGAPSRCSLCAQPVLTVWAEWGEFSTGKGGGENALAEA